jgi:hypothetical protein
VGEIVLLSEEEVRITNIMQCTEWSDVCDTLDADAARAEDRAAVRKKAMLVGEEYRNNDKDLFRFALDKTEDDEDWPSDGATRACAPRPAINFPRMLAMERWPPPELKHMPPEAMESLHNMIVPLLFSLNKHMHGVEWKLRQLCQSTGALFEASGSATQAKSAGRTPDFVNLLSREVRDYSPGTIPPHLARSLKEETDDQKDVREQRDSVWGAHEHHWLRDKKTWGKIDDKTRAEICTAMYKLPARWPWSVTTQRTIERITYVRGKPASKRKSMSSSSSTSSSPSKHSSSSSPSKPSKPSNPSSSSSSSSSSSHTPVKKLAPTEVRSLLSASMLLHPSCFACVLVC